MSVGILVAIDGPSGSGKSTVAKLVAKELGISYLDTGAMYRALTWLCFERGIDLSDEQSVRESADELDFSMVQGADGPRFFAGEVDVTSVIREPKIAEGVPVVARNIPVRKWMASEQRRLMLDARENGTGMVAEGRDITTVVCPEADVRVLLVADEEERLRRRTIELYGKETPELLEATRAQIGDRDASDAKVSDFLEAAEGVVTIDSSHQSIEQVVSQVIGLASNIEA
jgi:cytidylate kinase